MRQYETFELSFSGKALQERWSAIDLTAAFTCDGETKTVKGFYDGGGCTLDVYLVAGRYENAYFNAPFVRIEGAVIAFFVTSPFS